MKNLVYFSIAKYVPDVERKESINFGFAYYFPLTKEIGYCPTVNKKRILAFDDETDIETIEFLQESLSYDFSEESYNLIDDEDLEYYFSEKASPEHKIFLDKLYNYANLIQFDDVKLMHVESSLTKSIEDIKNFYLYYDRSKAARKADKASLLRVTNNLVKAYLPSEKYAKPKKSTHIFQAPFDFAAYSSEQTQYLKVCKFDYKHVGELFKELKALLTDIEYYNAAAKVPLSRHNYHLVINSLDSTNPQILEAHKLMEDRANIMLLDKLDYFLEELSENDSLLA